MKGNDVVAAYNRELMRLQSKLQEAEDRNKDGHFMEDLTVAALAGFLQKPDIVLDKLSDEEKKAMVSRWPTARQFARAAIHQAEAVMVEIAQLMVRADAEHKKEQAQTGGPAAGDDSQDENEPGTKPGLFVAP